MKKILYITIESKSRELYPKLFLVNSAIRKNFDCFVGDKVAISRAVKILGPGIYFYKSINHYDTKHIENIKKNNLYVSQDEEGGFARPNDKELNEYYHDGNFARVIKQTFVTLPSRLWKYSVFVCWPFLRKTVERYFLVFRSICGILAAGVLGLGE